jgi:hypothetical protein
MKKIFPWLLWLWLSAVIVAAFYYAPLAAGFKGYSSRILFFHVPMAWVSFFAFMRFGGLEPALPDPRGPGGATCATTGAPPPPSSSAWSTACWRP